MTIRSVLGLVGGLMITSALGCSGDEPAAKGSNLSAAAPTATATGALALTTAARDRVQGSFSHDAVTVSFDVQTTATARSVRLTVGDVVLTIDHDLTTLAAVVDGQNSGLSVAQKAALVALEQAIQGLDEEVAIPLVGDDPDNSALGTLLRHASYFSKSPTMRPVVRRTVQLHRASATDAERATGEGITYLNQCRNSASSGGKYATANWTQADGSWRSQQAACGNISGACEGRCGAGCPCTSWYCTNKYYTKDCFDHDVCLDNNPSDTAWSPMATNCGDEFDDAFDDYTFGSSSGW